jgi:hypothetical protein
MSSGAQKGCAPGFPSQVAGCATARGRVDSISHNPGMAQKSGKRVSSPSPTIFVAMYGFQSCAPGFDSPVLRGRSNSQ